MTLSRILLVSLTALWLTACSLFMSEIDEDVLVVAHQLLEEQKDDLGQPKEIEMPVRVNYSIHRKPLIAHALEVEFEFLPEQKIPVLRLGVSASDGLEIEAGGTGEKYIDVEARRAIKKQVIVVPTEENEFYLNLFVVTELGTDRRARQVKVPVALGKFSRR